MNIVPGRQISLIFSTSNGPKSTQPERRKRIYPGTNEGLRGPISQQNGAAGWCHLLNTGCFLLSGGSSRDCSATAASAIGRPPVVSLGGEAGDVASGVRSGIATFHCGAAGLIWSDAGACRWSRLGGLCRDAPPELAVYLGLLPETESAIYTFTNRIKGDGGEPLGVKSERKMGLTVWCERRSWGSVLFIHLMSGFFGKIQKIRGGEILCVADPRSYGGVDQQKPLIYDLAPHRNFFVLTTIYENFWAVIIGLNNLSWGIFHFLL